MVPAHDQAVSHRDMRDGYAFDFLNEVARAAGGTEVLDFHWGFALAQALEDGWRVIPPSGVQAADELLAALNPELDAERNGGAA